MSESVSETIDDGGPAFPIPGEVHPIMGTQPGCCGMSLRDWFAGHALSGLIASDDDLGMRYSQAAREAYALADSMLNEREKP